MACQCQTAVLEFYSSCRVLLVVGILTVSKEDFEDPEELFEAIGEVLLEVSDDGTTEEYVR